jgi:Raf kinase inhibitor-like YbhB/YbcL family protein
MMRGLALAAAVSIAGVIGASAAPAITVTSPDIKPGAKIADEQAANVFGCTGKNISPAISWSGAPKDAKSFALSIYDPDAPTGSGFWHWVVFNIPAGTASLPKNAGDAKSGLMPAGAVQSRTDFGAPGYGGPCPPKGDKPHHYHITVFAVDVDKIDADENTMPAVVGFNLHFHTLAKGELTGVYGR